MVSKTMSAKVVSEVATLSKIISKVETTPAIVSKIVSKVETIPAMAPIGVVSMALLVEMYAVPTAMPVGPMAGESS